MIRLATAADAAQLAGIYAPYVKQTAITFSAEPFTAAEFIALIEDPTFPFLVTEEAGQILGYAYASPFKGRPAYRWSVESSIYVKQGLHQKGIGRALYAALEKALALQGIQNVNACIAAPKGEDPYLNEDSIRFHEHVGYTMVGRFHSCASKFGRWYDMVWMEKHIGTHIGPPSPFRPFAEVKESFSLS